MQTECSPTLFEFEAVEGRRVEARFDGGEITSDAGALLLGRLDRDLGLLGRFAECFRDRRDPVLREHEVETLVGQRVIGIALGYEDLIDHDELRHDRVFHVLAGKLKARRADCAPVAAERGGRIMAGKAWLTIAGLGLPGLALAVGGPRWLGAEPGGPRAGGGQEHAEPAGARRPYRQVSQDRS